MCVVYKCHPTVGVEPFYHDFDSYLVCFSGNLSLSPAHFPLQQLKKREKKLLLNDKCCYCVVGTVVSHPRRHTPADCDEFTPEHQQFPPLTTLGYGSRCTSDPTFFPSVGVGGFSPPKACTGAAHGPDGLECDFWNQHSRNVEFWADLRVKTLPGLSWMTTSPPQNRLPVATVNKNLRFVFLTVWFHRQAVICELKRVIWPDVCFF